MYIDNYTIALQYFAIKFGNNELYMSESLMLHYITQFFHSIKIKCFKSVRFLIDTRFYRITANACCKRNWLSIVERSPKQNSATEGESLGIVEL